MKNITEYTNLPKLETNTLEVKTIKITENIELTPEVIQILKDLILPKP